MRRLYLRLFLRIINRNRDVYVLKILTLSVAFASAVVISLFVFNEFGYDKFHSNSDLVFRVLQKNIDENFVGNRYTNQIQKDVVSSLSSTFGDSLTLSRVKVMDGLTFSVDDKVWHGQKLHAADSSIKDIFTFDVIHGDLKNFSTRQPVIILSSSAALQYFDTASPIGESLRITALSDTVVATVIAVFNDFPDNSHEHFSGFIVNNGSTIRALNFDPSSSGVYGRANKLDVNHFQEAVDELQINRSQCRLHIHR